MADELDPPERDDPPGPAGDEIGLQQALEERYLAYALSTIMHRALPDARDGLKPVHRRIIYGMRLLRLDPGTAFKKSAKIVGDVMGTFHPHGDQAIYDALVRLAQDFSSRYPLIDGQGNFGNIDGDNAAAYRYTEARMTEVGRLLLQGIDEDAVDFRPNYDGSDEEPVVLPAALPNLLANGAQGIAVGMATSIPPHNAAELCDAALYLIEHRDATPEQLMHFVPGPDFPTGGIVVDDRKSISDTYRTGRGSFRVRARWTREETGRGTYVVVITEIPYMVQKGRLIETLAQLINDRKLPLLADVRDESAEDVRVVLEPRSRGVDPDVLMESVFRLSELETRISMNMNVLVDGRVPRVIGLVEALRIWLDHRRTVLVRRSRHRLAAIERRLEILGGLLIAYLNLDEVIRIIRQEDEPKAVLIATFTLTDVQANAILDTRLRSLRRLEEMEIQREFEALTGEKADLERLLASEPQQWTAIKREIRDARKSISPETALGRRRTTFAEPPDVGTVDISTAFIEREPVTVVLSEKGWLRALKGHVSDLSALTFRGDDRLKLSLHTETTAKLLVLVSNGKVFTIEAIRLPGGRGFGDPIRQFADVDEGAEVVAVWCHQPGSKLLLVATAATDVRGFVALADDLVATTKKGKTALVCDQGFKAALVSVVVGDHVAIVGENRRLLVFPLADIAEMSRGKGSRLQKYKDGTMSDIKMFALDEGLTWRSADGRTFSVTKQELTDWIGHRGDVGRLPPKGFPKNNRFVG
jgi:topoisomerase-4 subunit A